MTPSRPARPRRWPPLSPWRPSGCARRSRPPSRSAAAGRASCTTRRCRSWGRSSSCWRRAEGGRPSDSTDARRRGPSTRSSAITGLQSLITELRPASLDELGVEPAIEALAERTPPHRASRSTQHRSRGFARPRGRLEPEVESRLPARAGGDHQRRQARSRPACHRQDRRSGRQLSITVRDDGSGLRPCRRTAGGFGLLGMRERVAPQTGALAIGSGAGSAVPPSGARSARRRVAA